MSHAQVVVAYFKLRADHASFPAVLERLAQEFKEESGGHELGVNFSKDKKFAYVKASADSDVPEAVLVKVVPAEDVQEVREEVSAESWVPASSPSFRLNRGKVEV